MGDDALHMTSHRPYLLRALYEWVVDNGMTPHVLVDATLPGVRVPMQSVKDGRIVLNIAERAVGGLRMDNDALRFSARFGGVSQSVLVPLEAVIAVYSRETGQGMALPAVSYTHLDVYKRQARRWALPHSARHRRICR